MIPALAKVLEAQQFLSRNEVEAAAAVLGPAALKYPKDPNVLSLYSIILFRQRKYPQALHYAQRSVAVAPTDTNYHANLGLVQMANGKPEAAIASYKKALELDPENSEAMLSLANNALDNNDATLAIGYCERVLRRRMDAQFCPTYIAALAGMGRIDEALEFARRAASEFPDESFILTGRSSTYNYSWTASVREAAEAHFTFGRSLLASKPAADFRFSGSLDRNRPLRVGLLSADLRAHSVSYFIEPYLEHYDRDRIQLFAYSTTRHHDKVSARLKPHFKAWHDCGDLIDIEMCRIIEKDGIDILIDLGGLTHNNSATVFAYRPAPVQATYCGYPNTTGLPTIDWRLVDARTDPTPDAPESVSARAAGEPDFDQRCAERLMRLAPCFLCYRPPADAPPPKRDPAWPHLTFGSFNANKKIVPPLLDLWCELMRRVPDSRFILKTFEFKDTAPRERIFQAFEKGGINRSRIEILGPAITVGEHLAMYSRVDMAMDTMPYNGTTTTCEALWMGVPVITGVGATHAGRVGVSLLSVIGLPELIASTPAGTVDLAVALAADPARLAAYRAGLREKMAASPLCDAKAFSAGFTAALRAMWNDYVDRESSRTR
jgi:predicted O-linked N-acetylglucosamine transferase (SPINDLY family)